MTEFKYAGSVSTGTMRPEDLIPAFWHVLRELNADAVLDIDAEASADDEQNAITLDALFDGLEQAAPEGYRFGAHEGDGADYGFWRDADGDD